MKKVLFVISMLVVVVVAFSRVYAPNEYHTKMPTQMEMLKAELELRAKHYQLTYVEYLKHSFESDTAAIALLNVYCPDLSVSEVKALLMNSVRLERFIFAVVVCSLLLAVLIAGWTVSSL